MALPAAHVEPLSAPRAVLRLQGRSARFGAPTGIGLALLFLVAFGGSGAAMVALALDLLGPGRPEGAPRGILLAFGALFMFCGLAIGAQAARRILRERRARRMRGEYPDEPWRWERVWARETKDEGGRKLVQGLTTSVVMMLFLAPFHWIGLTQRGAGVFLVVTLIFDVFVLAYVVRAVHLALRYVRLGTSRLTLERVPCMLGEHLEATLTPARPIPGVQSLELTLRCVEERTEVQRRGNKSHHTVVHYALHTQLLTVEASALAEGRALPLSLPLPSDVPELTTCLTAEAPRYWELECRAARPGVDYRAVFLVPVY